MAEIVVPFLKWAGGKRWLAQHTAFEIPQFSGRYIEPFLGSGSIFFSLRPRDAILADINSELIATYEALRDDFSKVRLHLQKHAKSHCKNYYYRIRDNFHPTSTSGRAARFL